MCASKWGILFYIILCWNAIFTRVSCVNGMLFVVSALNCTQERSSDYEKYTVAQHFWQTKHGHIRYTVSKTVKNFKQSAIEASGTIGVRKEPGYHCHFLD